MDYEVVFSVAGVVAMFGRAVLLASPWMPVWSDRIAGLFVPITLAAGYTIMFVWFPADSGGFGSFAEVTLLFSNPEVLMAGWVHFLAFDLFVGAWICRQGRADGLRFWLVLPCLPVTFLFGPAGFLLFSLVRAVGNTAGMSERRAQT